MHKHHQVQHHSGFTLIEVLVSAVIMSIGLLGVMGMQMTSLTSIHDGYVRLQASLLANDIADRIRSNANNADLYVTQAGDSGTINADSDFTSPSCLASTEGCTNVEQVDADLYEWLQVIKQMPSNTEIVLSNEDDEAAGSLDIVGITIQIKDAAHTSGWSSWVDLKGLDDGEAFPLVQVTAGVPGS